LNWYLKNIFHNHVSWCGDQLNFPETLPEVGKKVTVSTVHKYRVYFNYCTLSYTAAWWDWKRWQREIDFMAMIKKFPDSKILKGHRWCEFDGTAQLDPLDPLFLKMGKTFLAEENKLFGSSHLYGCDPFHEGAPPIKGDEYLVKVGKNIQNLLNEHDSESIWVMQSWSIRKPIATAVPKDRLLVVDLGGQKHGSTKGFWDYNFVSGRLHNFGNRITLHGDVELLAQNPFARIKKEFPKNSSGMGLFMEGIIQNPVYYDMAFDLIWKTDPVNSTDWLHKYAHRRYGARSANAEKAWDILLETAYRKGTDGTEFSSIIAARPAITPKKSGPNRGLVIPYDPIKLLEAWRLLLEDAENLKDSDAYRFDIVDIGRQVLSNHGQDLQKRVREAYYEKNLKSFEASASHFHQLLRDVDQLLAPRGEYNLGIRVNNARSWGTTPEEKDQYERNMRELVTIWGPTENPEIFDYSWREWNGLIDGYYLKRWEMFHRYIGKLMREEKPYNNNVPMVYGREAFRANDFYKQLAEWEIHWVKTPQRISSELSGDEVDLAKAMYQKYADNIPKELARTKASKPVKSKGLQIGRWNAQKITTDYKTYTLPVDKYLNGTGTYQVIFEYTSGSSKLDIQSAELLIDEKVVSKDEHQGYAGHANKNNVYSLKLKQHAFGTKHEIRFTAKSDGGKNSNGTIYMKK